MKARYLLFAILVMMGIAIVAHGVLDWRWRHADFKRLFVDRIQSETPKDQTIATVDSPAEDIVIEPLSRSARLVCGPVYTRYNATGATAARHVYGMVVTEGLFRILINEGYGPKTKDRPDAEAAASDFCNQARSNRPGRNR